MASDPVGLRFINLAAALSIDVEEIVVSLEASGKLSSYNSSSSWLAQATLSPTFITGGTIGSEWKHAYLRSSVCTMADTTLTK